MVYENCKWCEGRGCMYCDTERQKDAQREIKPVFSANLDDPKDIERLKQFFGANAINEAWNNAEKSPDPQREFGRLMAVNGAIASILQLMDKERDEHSAEKGE